MSRSFSPSDRGIPKLDHTFHVQIGTTDAHVSQPDSSCASSSSDLMLTFFEPGKDLVAGHETEGIWLEGDLQDKLIFSGSWPTKLARSVVRRKGMDLPRPLIDVMLGTNMFHLRVSLWIACSKAFIVLRDHSPVFRVILLPFRANP